MTSATNSSVILTETTIGGRYRIRNYETEGAQGRIYKAHDKIEGKEVALKILKQRVAKDESWLHHFRDVPSKLEGLVDCDNVVRILGSGAHHAYDSPGHDYHVTEWIDGDNLTVWRDQHDEDRNKWVELAIGLCQGVKACHDVGLTHGDINPNNIMIKKGEVTSASAILVDFGLARYAEDHSTLTRGFTLRYAAPEVLEDDENAGKHPGDIYSLGAVLFFLFTGDHCRPEEEGELREAILEKETPSLASRSGGVQIDDLDALLGKMLDKNPANRPDASDALSELQTIHRRLDGTLATTSFSGAEPSTGEDLIRKVRHWKQYLDIWKRDAEEKKWQVRYKGWKAIRHRHDRHAIRLNLEPDDIPWKKIADSRDGRVKLAWPAGVGQARPKEFGELITHSRKNATITIEFTRTDRFYKDHWDPKQQTYNLPDSGELVYDSSGDLHQINQQVTALNKLSTGETNNPGLNRFIFDASRASPLPAGRKYVPLGRDNLLERDLNAKQLKAVEGALNAPDLYLIQGPPGTGKTTVIAELCYQFALRGQRVLIASQANLAIDNAMSKLMHHQTILALRLGAPDKVEEEGQPFLAEHVIDTWFKRTAKDCKKWIEDADLRLKNYSELLDNMDKVSKYADLVQGHEKRLSGLKKEVDTTQKKIDKVEKRTSRITAKQAELRDLTDLVDKAEKILQEGHVPSEIPDGLLLWHRRGEVGFDPVDAKEYQQFLEAVVWGLETVKEIQPKLDQDIIADCLKSETDHVLLRNVRDGKSDARLQLRDVTAVLRIGQQLADVVRERLPEIREMEENIAPMKELLEEREPLLYLVGIQEVETALRASERSIECYRQYIEYLDQLEKEEGALESIIESVSAAKGQIRQETDRQQQMQGLQSKAYERMRLCVKRLGDMSRCNDDYQRNLETDVEQAAQLHVSRLLRLQDSPQGNAGWLDWKPENDLRDLPKSLHDKLRGRDISQLLNLWTRVSDWLKRVENERAGSLSDEVDASEVKDTEDALAKLFVTAPDGKEHARDSATVEDRFKDILAPKRGTVVVRYTALSNFLPRLTKVLENARDELNESIREILADIDDTSPGAENERELTEKLESTKLARQALKIEMNHHTSIWSEYLDFIKAQLDEIDAIGQASFFQLSRRALEQAAITGSGFQRKTFENAEHELQASLEPSPEVKYEEHLAKYEENRSSQDKTIRACKKQLSSSTRKLQNSVGKLEDAKGAFVAHPIAEQDKSISLFEQHLGELHTLLSQEEPALTNATVPCSECRKTNRIRARAVGGIHSCAKCKSPLKDPFAGAIFEKLEDNATNILTDLRGKVGSRKKTTSLDEQLAGVVEQIDAEIARLTEHGYRPAHWSTPSSEERHSPTYPDIWKSWLDWVGDVSKDADLNLARLQPTVVLKAVRKHTEDKVSPLEQELEAANGEKETHKDTLQEAQQALDKYEREYREEQDWWAEKHASIPHSLRAGGQKVPNIHQPFYVAELIDSYKKAPQVWSGELERQRGLAKTATPIARDWSERLRQRREEDLATLKHIYQDKANVIGVTCGAVDRLLKEYTEKVRDRRTPFDVVIIDESSRATPPELLLPILEGKKTILVGDQNQLPPILLNRAAEEIASDQPGVKAEDLEHLEIPLFGRLYDTAPEKLCTMLTIQYRMRPAIMEAINQFYDRQLTGGERVKEHGMHIGPVKPNTSIAWIRTPRNKEYEEDSKGTSKFNKKEVDVIKSMLQAMNGVWRRKIAADKTLPLKDVGVITFYKAQERLLMEQITGRANSGNFPALDIRVGTVDRFQGMERSIVLVSLVRNNNRGDIGFAKNSARINVAFSRARELLVIVGCKTLFTEEAKSATKARGFYNEVSEVVRLKGLGISVSDFRFN